MNVIKRLAILSIIGITSLYAIGVKDIDQLVEEINTTTDQKIKGQLLDKLESQLESIDRKDLTNAEEIVNKKLEKPKTLKN